MTTQLYFVKWYQKVEINPDHLIELERWCFDLTYDEAMCVIASRVEGETDYMMGEMQDFQDYIAWSKK